MRLDLDTEVRYPSGELAGRLARVGLDANNEVSQVVLATSDLISRMVIIPVDLLYEGDGQTVYLNAMPDELDQMPDYVEDRVPVMGEDWDYSENASAMAEVFPATAYEPIVPVIEVTNLEGEAVSIGQGTEVWCLDERWGLVDEVLVDDSGQVKTLIATPDAVEDVRRIIPIELVRETDTNRVVLNCTTADLPNYTDEVPGEASLAQDTE